MTVGRPRSFDPEIVVQHALDRFWSNGFQATSMQDLMDCTGLSKSSLYESFGSKQTLFEHCIASYREERVAKMSQRLAAADSGLSFIRDMLESVAFECRNGSPRGCLVMNTAAEFSQRDPQVARLVAQSITAFSGVFRRAVRQAQAEGDIPRHKDAARLASFIVTNMSGLRTLGKGGASQKTLRSTAQLVIQALQA
jgi:AcrR family transcriptional regulator